MSNTDEQAVMVKVTNIEEEGSDRRFSTLQPNGLEFPVTATLTDPDNMNCGVDSLEWQWYRRCTNIATD